MFLTNHPYNSNDKQQVTRVLPTFMVRQKVDDFWAGFIAEFMFLKIIFYAFQNIATHAERSFFARMQPLAKVQVSDY